MIVRAIETTVCVDAHHPTVLIDPGHLVCFLRVREGHVDGCQLTLTQKKPMILAGWKFTACLALRVRPHNVALFVNSVGIDTGRTVYVNSRVHTFVQQEGPVWPAGLNICANNVSILIDPACFGSRSSCEGDIERRKYSRFGLEESVNGAARITEWITY